MDGDFIMNEELSDISYQQKNFKKELLLYADGESDLAAAFKLDNLDDKRKEMISYLYRFLSPEATNVIDLHVYGKLSVYQIAAIKETDEQTIESIINSVKEKINYAMGKLNDQG
jgi:DNA-directed RNA polymerase specialized sigma24 family protein